MKRVAVPSMIIAEAGSSWTATPPIVFTCNKIKVGTELVAIRASAVFTGPNNATETLVLEPSNTKLKCSGNSLLREGDSVKNEATGNKIYVDTGTGKLFTA